MSKIVLDFGTEVDILNKSELQEALAEDARLRAIVAGVKSVDAWFPTGQLNPSAPSTGVLSFSTPVNMINSGFVWAIMNMGIELNAGSAVRVYKGVPSAAFSATVSNGRLVTQFASGGAQSQGFSKGQVMLRAGDQLTFVATQGTNLIMNVFLTGIEIPAERIGEILL